MRLNGSEPAISLFCDRFGDFGRAYLAPSCDVGFCEPGSMSVSNRTGGGWCSVHPHLAVVRGLMPIALLVIVGTAFILPPGFVVFFVWALWRLTGTRGR